MLTVVQFVVLLAHWVSGWQISVSSAEQSCHWNCDGAWLQFPVSVTVVPTVGRALLAATVQVGDADAAVCQLSVMFAGALLPRLLTPITP